MINVATDRLREKSLSKATFRKQTSSSQIEHWLLDLEKWIRILENWETEGQLVLKLLQAASFGESEGQDAIRLQRAFENTLLKRIKPLKLDLFQFQSDIDRMEHFPQSSNEKMQQFKNLMRRLGDTYQQLKTRILRHLLKVYPTTII